MPAGKPWLTQAPALDFVPNTAPFWHVFREDFTATAYNPNSKARLALVGSHHMYYVSDTLSGALWESVLRDTLVRNDLTCDVQTWALRGFRAAMVRLESATVPLLRLERPGRRALFDIGSKEDLAVDSLLLTPVHAQTHGEAVNLRNELSAHGVKQMPMLSWSSRQHQASTVYLSYSPPMGSSDWRVVPGSEIALDDAANDYAAIRGELARCGFTWTKLATSATTPGPMDE